MITTYEEYRKNYLDLMEADGTIPAYLRKMVNPESESKFIINADTREIKIPKEFERGVAVYKDYKSETLFFEIDRYFDDADLLTKRCCVQIINANGEQTALPMDYMYLSENNLKVILGWTLTHEVSVKEGAVTFSIRFFSLDDEGKTLTYNWSTRPTTINVYQGLYITEGAATIPSKTTLESLLDKIQSILHNGVPSYDYNNLNGLPTIGGAQIIGDISPLILALINGEGSGGKFLTINDVLPSLLTPGSDKGVYPVSNDGLYRKFELVDTEMTNFETALEAIQEELGDMTFVPIDIEKFTVSPIGIEAKYYTDGNPLLVENGVSIGRLLFSWKMNKVPATLIINEDTIPSPSMEGTYNKTLTTSITTNQTFTLKATEKRGEPTTKTTDLIFCNKASWCVRAAPESVDLIDKAWLYDYMGDNFKLVNEADFEIEVNIENGKYLYITLPNSIGTNFNFYFDGSGVPGGMDFVKDMYIEGLNDYVAKYNIYKSTNPGLGQRKLMIKER